MSKKAIFIDNADSINLIPEPQDGYYLKVNDLGTGFEWIPGTSITAGLRPSGQDGYVAIADGSDINWLAGTTSGDMLTWNGSAWTASAPSPVNETLEEVLTNGNLSNGQNLIINDDGYLAVTSSLDVDVLFVDPQASNVVTVNGNIDLNGTLIADSAIIDNNVTIHGNLFVDGYVVSLDVDNISVFDNYIDLSQGYTNAVAKTGGLVVNYLPTATVDTVGVGGFTAGVVSTSNPTVITVGSATFAVNDIVMISSTADPVNSGIFEVLSHVGTTLTIKGIGITPTVEDFTSTQLVTDPSAVGNITKINVSVIRAGDDGVWEVGQGSETSLDYFDLITTDTLTTPTWADVLSEGAVSGGTNPEISAGDSILLLGDNTNHSISFSVDGTTSGGDLTLSAQNTSNANAGEIVIAGAVTTVVGGGVLLSGGSGDDSGGSINIESGSGGVGGNINLTTGGGASGGSINLITDSGLNAGNINLTPGGGTVGGSIVLKQSAGGTRGKIRLQNSLATDVLTIDDSATYPFSVTGDGYFSSDVIISGGHEIKFTGENQFNEIKFLNDATTTAGVLVLRGQAAPSHGNAIMALLRQNVLLEGADGYEGGAIILEAGNGGSSSLFRSVNLLAGDGVLGGDINVTAGNGAAEVGGNVIISAGISLDASDGYIQLGLSATESGFVVNRGTVDSLLLAGDGYIITWNSTTESIQYTDPSIITPTWSEVLSKGAVSGGVSPEISAGDSILLLGDGSDHSINFSTDGTILGGSLTLSAQNGVAGEGGDISLLGGDGYNGGDISLIGGDGGFAGGGDMLIQSGSGFSSGVVFITTPTADTAGSVSISTGYGNFGGNINLTAGGGTTGGSINLATGGGANAGDINITPGAGAVGGSIILKQSTGGTRGKVRLQNSSGLDVLTIDDSATYPFSVTSDVSVAGDVIINGGNSINFTGENKVNEIKFLNDSTTIAGAIRIKGQGAPTHDNSQIVVESNIVIQASNGIGEVGGATILQSGQNPSFFGGQSQIVLSGGNDFGGDVIISGGSGATDVGGNVFIIPGVSLDADGYVLLGWPGQPGLIVNRDTVDSLALATNGYIVTWNSTTESIEYTDPATIIGSTSTLSEVLSAGNITDGYNIEVSDGDDLIFVGGSSTLQFNNQANILFDQNAEIRAVDGGIFTRTGPFPGPSAISGSIDSRTGQATSISGNVGLYTGDSDGYSGDIILSCGDGYVYGGGFTLTAGSSNGEAGTLLLGAGNTFATLPGASAGNVSINAGNYSGGGSGAIISLVGGESGFGGAVSIVGGGAGSTNIGGNVSISSGNGSTISAGISGEVNINSFTNAGSGNSGNVTINSGNTQLGNSGALSILGGISTSGTGGPVSIYAGASGGANNGAQLLLAAGNAVNGNGGKTSIYSGGSASGNAADLELITGNGVIDGAISLIIGNNVANIVAKFSPETFATQEDGYVLAWNDTDGYLEYVDVPKIITRSQTTTSNTPTAIYTYGTTSNSVIQVQAKINAFNSTANEVSSWDVFAVFKNIGGTLTQVGLTSIRSVETEDLSLDVDFSVATTNINLNVTGTSDTISWKSQITVFDSQ